MTPKQIKELKDWASYSGGLSSWTIISVLVPKLHDFCEGLCHGDLGRTPSDPSDLRRCFDALALIPGGVTKLSKVAKRYPSWEPLVKEWPELWAMYWAEEPSGKAPKTFKRMRELHGDFGPAADRVVSFGWARR